MLMTIRRLRWGLKWLLGMSRGGRNFGIFSDDVFIVSYPRSGNTWMRFLIANLVDLTDAATFANIERKIPDVYKNTRNQLGRIPRPRILKSHEYFDPRYKRVIYIVRDPRDVVISYYHFHRKTKMIEDGYSIDQYVTRFIAGNLDEYGSWEENVASWLATRRARSSFLLLRYEDLLEHPARELSKIATFLCINRSSAQLARAIELSSADRMRQLERSQAEVWIGSEKTRKDIPFVRTATSGGWRSAAAQNWVAQIELAWGSAMAALGYDLLTTVNAGPAEDVTVLDGTPFAADQVR
jgi:hypothetical protein